MEVVFCCMSMFGLSRLGSWDLDEILSSGREECHVILFVYGLLQEVG